MNPTIIKPTVGRVVLFRPPKEAYIDGFTYDPNQPCAALVTYVWHDDMVNLAVFDQNGIHHPVTSVPLVQAHEPKPSDGFYCEWMPYQIGQAQRHEQRNEFESAFDKATINR